jgi:hypothetical protein
VDQHDLSITSAFEQFALSLGRSAAVPVADLVRALEQTAEGLRAGARPEPRSMPSDLIPQAEAARVAGVSRQAIHQWIRKGTLRAYPVPSATGRGAALVSRTDVIIVANRGTEVPFSPALRAQLMAFAELLEPVAAGVDGVLTAALRRLSEPTHGSGPGADAGSGEAASVLREFVTAAMGTSSRQQEFTPAGVHMLASLRPRIVVDPRSPFGELCGILGLLVHSARGFAGFDSASAAVLALIGCATFGPALDEPSAAAGRQTADAAEQVWGQEWLGRLYDLAFHLGDVSPAPLTRYTASLTYLGTNRYLRQAQSDGVTITYARSPGLLLPQSYYGDAVLQDILEGRRDPSSWRFRPESAALARAAMTRSEGNPFRVFSFDFGLLEPSIHGVRRYCYSTQDARTAMRRTMAALPAAQRAAYRDIATGLLARTLAHPHMEVTAVDRPDDFDWWKDHIIRSSARETMLGLRDPEARKVAHGLLVQTSMLPDVIEAANTDNSLRDRLRLYVKNLEFELIHERYADDLRRGVSRAVKAAAEVVSPDCAQARAEAEIARLLD